MRGHYTCHSVLCIFFHLSWRYFNVILADLNALFFVVFHSVDMLHVIAQDPLINIEGVFALAHISAMTIFVLLSPHAHMDTSEE